MLEGYVLTDVRTVLFDHTVTTVSKLPHHLKKMPLTSNYLFNAICVSCHSKHVRLINMVKTVPFNVPKIAMEHVDI